MSCQVKEENLEEDENMRVDEEVEIKCSDIEEIMLKKENVDGNLFYINMNL